jgi:dATP pyrophosphohydrolase
MEPLEQIPLRSLAVAVYVCRRTPDGPRWLILKRSDGLPAYGGLWQPITGALAEGETGAEAAVREVREESALEVRELWSADMVESFYEPRTHSIWVNAVFVAFVDPDGEVRLSEEHAEYLWATCDEARRRLPLRQWRDNLLVVDQEFVQRQPCSLLRIELTEADP